MAKQAVQSNQFKEVITSLDQQIAKLQKARALLLEGDAPEAPVKRGPGRPRKTEAPVAAPARKKAKAS